MKGSHKFWSLILTVIIVFLNYTLFFTDKNYFIGNATGFEVIFCSITILLDISICFISGFLFYDKILPRFNKYLDEKF